MEEKLNFIPYALIATASSFNADPVLLECAKRMFDWANNMGLHGKKVRDLTLISEDKDYSDPLALLNTFYCKIECTEEERKAWEERQKLEFNQCWSTDWSD